MLAALCSRPTLIWQALCRGDWLPSALVATWGHAARTTLAALMALGVAYVLELGTPYSAAVTVLLVAHPVHGMVLAKSTARLFGTLIGAVMAIALMGMFSQSPELFMLGLSLWMGLCTLASTLLRNFRSYESVLAGYTVVLIVLPGVDAPDQMFDLMTSRVSVVTIGIVCSGLVAALLTSRSAVRGLRARLRGTMRSVNSYVRLALSDDHTGRIQPLRRKLGAEIIELDALLEFAATESAEVAPLRDTLRAALAAMLGVLAGAASLHEALRRVATRPANRESDPILISRMAESLALLSEIEAALGEDEPRAAGVRLTGLAQRLAQLESDIEAGLDPNDLPSLVAHDRLAEVLDELGVALAGVMALGAGRLPPPGREGWDSLRRPGALAFHLDWRGGMINGLRATVAVWFAGAIWILSGWPYGWMMVGVVVPNVGLLAMRDHPEQDAVEFVKGCTIAAVLGWVSLNSLLPMADDFFGLCLVLGPCLFLAVVLATNPKTVFIGIGIMVFYLVMLTPTNPMVYDANLYLNSVLATLAGGVLSMVVFRLILPSDPQGHVRAMIRTIRRDIEALLASGPAVAPAAWESRMHDRMLRLLGRMRVAEMSDDGLIRGGFASLRIGREIIRARRLLAEIATDRTLTDVMTPSWRALRHLGRTPAGVVRALRRSAAGLLLLAERERAGDAHILVRVAASLIEVAFLIGRNRRFFRAGALPSAPTRAMAFGNR